MNFASTGQRLLKLQKWLSPICRCCNLEVKSDTFYVFYYENKTLCDEKEAILDNLFEALLELDCSSELTDLLTQVFLFNQYYEHPSH